jgi:hypothetical protein
VFCHKLLQLEVQMRANVTTLGMLHNSFQFQVTQSHCHCRSSDSSTLTSAPQRYDRLLNLQMIMLMAEPVRCLTCRVLGGPSVCRQPTYAALLHIGCKPLPVQCTVLPIIDLARVQCAPNGDLRGCRHHIHTCCHAPTLLLHYVTVCTTGAACPPVLACR